LCGAPPRKEFFFFFSHHQTRHHNEKKQTPFFTGPPFFSSNSWVLVTPPPLAPPFPHRHPHPFQPYPHEEHKKHKYRVHHPGGLSDTIWGARGLFWFGFPARIFFKKDPVFGGGKSPPPDPRVLRTQKKAEPTITHNPRYTQPPPPFLLLDGPFFFFFPREIFSHPGGLYKNPSQLGCYVGWGGSGCGN